jgi:chromosomal replication initiator protein
MERGRSAIWEERGEVMQSERATGDTLEPWAIRLALPVATATPPPEHTFDSFVVGASNAAAHAAARALVDTGRRALYLHGPVGVGKSHLLHAIFHGLEARGTVAACLPAAQLVAGLVGAYGGRAPAHFWQALAPLGALLLDDLHSLAGQEEVQERLTEGLTAWVEGGRLLVLTSDRRPAEQPELSGRLRERFAADLTARIAPPEPSLRVAILQRKAHACGLPLDDGLAAWIAARVGGNVRRLEGALLSLVAHARLLGRQVDRRLAEAVVPPGDVVGPLTVERVLTETAAAFGANARAVRGRSRRAALVLPRQVAMYLSRELLARPFAELATAFTRDHSTVLQAWRAIARRLPTDVRLSERVRTIERRLLGDERATGE